MVSASVSPGRCFRDKLVQRTFHQVELCKKQEVTGAGCHVAPAPGEVNCFQTEGALAGPAGFGNADVCFTFLTSVLITAAFLK